MFGIPVANFDKHLESNDKYIIAINTNIFPLSRVDGIIAVNSLGETYYQKSQTTLDNLIETLTKNLDKLLEFYYSGDILYILFDKNKFPYQYDTMFIVQGIRGVLPLKDNEDYIDVPDNLLDLFYNYVLKYTHTIQGLKVPSDILININNLEKSIGENYDIH